MKNRFDDISLWPLSRVLRAFVLYQPDGRIWAIFSAINIVAGCVITLLLLISSYTRGLAWVDVLLFLGMPLVGFVWFLRDLPSSAAIDVRYVFQKIISSMLQCVAGLLPWFTLLH